MSHNKIIIGVIVVVILVLGISFAIRNTQESSVIKIGVIAPLTGKTAPYGTATKEGMDLATGELADTKIQGKSVQLVYEDTGGELKNVASAAQKLIHVDHVVALVSAGPSQESVALAPIAQDAHIPLVAAISQAGELTDAGDYVFRMTPEIKTLAERAAQISYQQGNHTAAVIGATGNPATKEAHAAFVTAFTALGGTVVDEEKFGPETTDFKTNVSRMAVKHPDAVFVSALVNEAGLILKQMQELGLKAHVFGVGSIEDKKLITVAHGNAEGVIFTTFNAPAPDAFAKKIKDKYNAEPRRFNQEGYEAYGFVFQALKNAASLDGAGVQQALANIKTFQGVTDTIAFDEKGNGVRTVYVKIIKNGNFELYNATK